MAVFLTPVPLHEEDVFSFIVRREMDLTYAALLSWWATGQHNSEFLTLTSWCTIEDATAMRTTGPVTVSYTVTLGAAREQVYEFLRKRNIHLDGVNDISEDIGHMLQAQYRYYTILLDLVFSSNFRNKVRFPRVVNYHGVQFTVTYEETTTPGFADNDD